MGCSTAHFVCVTVVRFYLQTHQTAIALSDTPHFSTFWTIIGNKLIHPWKWVVPQLTLPVPLLDVMQGSICKYTQPLLYNEHTIFGHCTVQCLCWAWMLSNNHLGCATIACPAGFYLLIHTIAISLLDTPHYSTFFGHCIIHSHTW